MALSDSVDLNYTRDEIITEALEILGVLGAGESPSTDDVATSTRPLNNMLKAMQADGLHLWKQQEITLALTDGTSDYDILDGASGVHLDEHKPLRVLNALSRRSNGDRNLTMVTREEYLLLGDKTAEGSPSQYFYDPKLRKGTFIVYPTPGSDAATNESIIITVSMPFDDLDAPGDDLDFPQEWYEAITYGLAVRLAPKYGIALKERMLLMQEAKMYKDMVSSFDREEGSMYLRPSSRGES